MLRKATIIAVAAVSGLLASCNGGRLTDAANEVQTTAESDSLLALGTMLTDSVQNVLRARLVKAMQDSGAAHAIRFCNVQATDLTATLNEKYGVEVQRLSHRNRNPSNRCDTEAQIATDKFIKVMAEGQETNPMLVQTADGAWNYYRPIVTGPVCLTCHGPADQIMPEVKTALAALYPNDRATGFAAGDLRGVWKVTFGKELRATSYRPQATNLKH